jgi:hypothetical protein
MSISKILVGISVATLDDSKSKSIGRLCEGDICAISKRMVIGKKEKARFLWFITSIDLDQFEEILEMVDDVWKRRYTVDLDALAKVYAFDIDRVRDIADDYQPFLTVDPDDGTFLAPDESFILSGLIWDKVETRYI